MQSQTVQPSGDLDRDLPAVPVEADLQLEGVEELRSRRGSAPAGPWREL
jgi:hypothetical protein